MRPAVVLLTVLSFASAATTANADTIEMKVNGLVCGFCAQGIEKTLRRNRATVDVVVSLENKLVVVATRAGKDIPDDELRKVLTASGYEVKAIERSATPLEQIRERIGTKAK